MKNIIFISILLLTLLTGCSTFDAEEDILEISVPDDFEMILTEPVVVYDRSDYEKCVLLTGEVKNLPYNSDILQKWGLSYYSTDTMPWHWYKITDRWDDYYGYRGYIKFWYATSETVPEENSELWNYGYAGMIHNITSDGPEAVDMNVLNKFICKLEDYVNPSLKDHFPVMAPIIIRPEDKVLHVKMTWLDGEYGCRTAVQTFRIN